MPEKDTKGLKIIRMTIVQPLICQWTCPGCKKPNQEHFLKVHPRVKKVKCGYCFNDYFGALTEDN